MDPTRIFAWLKVREPGAGQPAPHVPLLARPFLDDFLVTLACDTGKYFELLQRHHLEALGFDEDQAFDVGLRNLEAFIASGGVKLHAAGDIFALIAGGNFESSLMLVDQLWPQVAAQLGGTRLFAATPARDLLAVAPATPAGEKALRRWLEHCATLALDHSMNTTVYSWEETSWRRVDELPRGS